MWNFILFGFVGGKKNCEFLYLLEDFLSFVVFVCEKFFIFLDSLIKKFGSCLLLVFVILLFFFLNLDNFFFML